MKANRTYVGQLPEQRDAEHARGVIEKRSRNRVELKECNGRWALFLRGRTSQTVLGFANGVVAAIQEGSEHVDA